MFFQKNMKVVIIHGTFGSPQENWFPWLKQKLEAQWHSVRVPKLSTPENQLPSVRCDELQQQVPFIFDNDTVLIGHSLGATYLLHILDRERKESVKKAIFVSWFVHDLWNPKFDILNKPFIEKKFDRERIKKNIWNVIILHGDNDPYVPISEAQNLNQKLWWTLEIIPWWGHCNAESGYTTFQKLLDYFSS